MKNLINTLSNHGLNVEIINKNTVKVINAGYVGTPTEKRWFDDIIHVNDQKFYICSGESVKYIVESKDQKTGYSFNYNGYNTIKEYLGY